MPVSDRSSLWIPLPPFHGPRQSRPWLPGLLVTAVVAVCPQDTCVSISTVAVGAAASARQGRVCTRRDSYLNYTDERARAQIRLYVSMHRYGQLQEQKTRQRQQRQQQQTLPVWKRTYSSQAIGQVAACPAIYACHARLLIAAIRFHGALVRCWKARRMQSGFPRQGALDSPRRRCMPDQTDARLGASACWQRVAPRNTHQIAHDYAQHRAGSHLSDEAEDNSRPWTKTVHKTENCRRRLLQQHIHQSISDAAGHLPLTVRPPQVAPHGGALRRGSLQRRGRFEEGCAASDESKLARDRYRGHETFGLGFLPELFLVERTCKGVCPRVSRSGRVSDTGWSGGNSVCNGQMNENSAGMHIAMETDGAGDRAQGQSSAGERSGNGKPGQQPGPALFVLLVLCISFLTSFM